ncbi:MAG: ferredoxin reductase family protein [Spirochaetia bacterium]
MNKKKVRVLLFFYYLGPLIIVAVAYGVDSSFVSDFLLGVALLSGVYGYSWLMVQLILSARLKVLERGIGQDRLLVFHRMMAPLSLLLLLVHVVIKLWLYPASLQVVGGIIAFVGFSLVGFFSAALLSGTHKNSVFAGMRKLIYQKWKMQYHHIKALHNSTFLLSILIFLHVLGSSTAAISVVLRVYFIVLAAAALTVYMYHKLFRPWLKDPVYRVVKVEQPSDQVTTIGFELEKGRAVRHNPGQFAFYRFLDGVPGKEEHPFTISAGTKGSDQKSYLSFSAKALGDFTEALPSVQVGARLKVNGPYGVFSYRSLPQDSPLVWIAGGIGITPFLSMARSLVQERNVPKPVLLWNARRPEDFIYSDELKRAAELVPVLDGQQEYWDGRRGRITEELLQEVLSGEAIRRAMFFICGPPAMMTSVRGSLKSLGVDSSRMIWERFSL